MAALGLLQYMRRYPSIDYGETIGRIRDALRVLYTNLATIDGEPRCLSISDLERAGLYKRKYDVYGAYLAAISSIPILHKVSSAPSIVSSISAKVAAVTGIKVIDNINDRIHDFGQAVKSQLKYEQALTQENFSLDELDEDNSWLSRAENSTHMMARCTYRTLAKSAYNSSEMFDLFRRDVSEYVNGQIRSFYQRSRKFKDANIDLPEYLRAISTKGFGKLWIDVDFCFYEEGVGELDEDQRRTLDYINKSLGLLFKSLCIYDDVTDLREDLRDGTISSVMILGMEQGKYSKDELYDDYREGPNFLARKLEEHGIVQDTIHLGDLAFLKAIDWLLSAKEHSEDVDVDALIYCARVLRLFLLRKKVLGRRDFGSLRTFMLSLTNLDGLRSSIPENILCYNELLQKTI